jgi:hypothetical protein
MKKQITICLAFALLTLGISAKVNAAPTELITNGGFETGAFTGWTVTDQAGGSGSWFVDTPGTWTPLSGHLTVGGGSGAFYAVSDQTGPGTHSLTQAFTVPWPALSATLSFDMFVNDWDSGAIINPAGLNYTAVPNQHARVDILTTAAGAFDTGAGVLANYYLGVDGGPDPHGFTHYAFDITSIVGAGGTFQLRFAEVDNQSYFNQGVDNVSILVEPVPAPGAILLAGIGVGVVGWLRRRRTL